MSYNSLVGKNIGERYRIDDLLGQGGMSAVYKAFDPNLKRIVAVKVIHPHLADDPKFVIRFEEEAAAVAQLRHPNIVQVFDFNHDKNLYYMVQEFVPGETLQELLRRLSKSGERMPLAEAIQYTLDICDAAGYAHQRGMIHRDIKPANIILNVNGSAILMDFGIVKITGGVVHTATGAVVGTALYMPPEIIRGEVPDARADIYSLGVTLFEMVSGRPPFEADSAMTLMMMHMRDPLPNMYHLRPEVPEGLIAVIAKALAKDPNDRYASMAELSDALKGVLHNLQPGVVAPATLVYETQEPPGIAAAGSTQVDAPAGTEDEKISAGQVAGAGIAMGVASQAAASGGEAAADIPADRPTGTMVDGSSPSASKPPPASGDAKSEPRKGVHPGVWIALAVVFLCVVLGGIGVGLTVFGNGGDTAAEPGDELAATQIVAAGGIDAEIPTMTPTASAPPTIIAEPTEQAPPTLSPTPTKSPTATLIPTPTIPPGIPFVRIIDIGLDGNANYVVSYETFEFVEQLPGTHIHFFFNTVPPEEAGLPQGSGQWKIYGGPRPFSEYNQNQRPVNATQMCALVANPDHSVQAGSGYCFDLPDVVLATAVQDTACLVGPDPAFSVLTPLFAGQRLQVQGISPDEKYWFVTNPNNPSESCWLAQAESIVSGDISTLGLIEPPPLPEGASANHLSVEITGITIDEQGSYVADYLTQGFTEQLPGTHLHFFFNNVSPEEVGMSGSGNRLMYGGPSPFTGYKSIDRPEEATELCVLVTNPDHSVILESGNCMPLPEGGPTSEFSVQITQVTFDEQGNYVADYVTQGFAEQLPGMHLHFFFNTVPPEEVGIDGGGNRLMYGGPSPFSGYKSTDRPAEATQLCALVTNPDHSVILGSGNCMPLPDAPADLYGP